MLRLDNLQYRYPGGAGLGPLTYDFLPGSVYAIVGPNGAGKSTLFNILAGLLPSQKGIVSVDGTASSARIPLPILGFLPETSLLNPRFTPRQALQFDAAMRGFPLSAAQLMSRLEAFGCHDFADQKITSLSQGMAKRVALAIVFQPTASVLILDEPLNGIDTQTLIQLRERVLEARESGQTLLISSHILSFVDEVTDEILFLSHGCLAARTPTHAGQAEQIYRHLFMRM